MRTKIFEWCAITISSALFHGFMAWIIFFAPDYMVL